MEQFVSLTAIAAPLMRINIDTDQIIPARFLVRTSDEGIGKDCSPTGAALRTARPIRRSS